MANNMFLEFDGPALKGTSTSAQGKEQIEILSFNHGISMPLTAGASNLMRSTGRSVHQDMTVTKFFDLTSPTLWLKCAGGEDFKHAKIHMWHADSAGKPTEYVTITLEKVIVTSCSVGGGGGGDDPIETITMNYEKITWLYNQQDAAMGAKGKASGSWDLETNTGK